MRRTTKSLPPVLAPVRLAAESADKAARTVEAVFLSGMPIARFPLFDDPFWLEFVLTPGAADFGRVRGGTAPILDAHNHGGVGAVLGKVESATIRNGEARATLRFSKRPELDSLWADIEDGILGAVSAGVVLHEVEEQTPRKGTANMRRFRATRWELMEVSLVSVPADGGARIEASANERHPCRVTFGGSPMRLKKCPACSVALSDDYDSTDCPECETDLEAALAARDELARVAELNRLASHYRLGDVQAQRWARDGTSPADAAREGAALRASRQPQQTNDIGFGNGEDYDAPHARISAMAANLAQRARGAELTGPAQRYGELTFGEAALECLRARGQHRGLDLRRYGGRQRAVELALHTSSDFPSLLADAMHRSLLPAYETASPTYRMIARRRVFNDFRVHHFDRLGDFPTPLQTNEHGEIKFGTIGEAEETGVLLSYGRLFGITRRVLVDDDLGAFGDLAQRAAIRTADFVNARFFELMISPNAGLGATMSDAAPIFDASHGNIAGAGALSVSVLGEGRALMMNQRGVGPDGVRLNVAPRYLLTSPESLTTAEQLTTQITPPSVEEVNPFQSRLVAIGDANLSGTRFYLLGDPARGTNFIYGGLSGNEGPRVDVRPGWDIEGVEVRLVVEVGFAAVEWRFGCSGAGA